MSVLEREFGGAAAGHRGIDVDIGLGVERQGVGAPAHRLVHVDRPVRAAGAAAAVNGDVAAGKRSAQRRPGHVAAAGRDGEVGGVNQPGSVAPAQARRGQGADGHVVAKAHLARAGIDEATVTAGIAASGRDAAVDLGDAGGIGQVGNQRDRAALACADGIGRDAAAVTDLVRCPQHDASAVVHQPVGLQHAAVVDHAALHPVQRLRRQDDESAGRLHRLAVIHQAGDGGGRDLQPGERVRAVDVQGEGLPSSHRHRTQLGHHHALVAHRGREQGDVAAQRGGQSAVVLYGASRSVSAEAVAARHEGIVADAVGGGDQAAHVHAGAGRKVDARGVGQKHLAVGADAPEDLAGVAAQHTVECDAAGARLHKIHLRGAAHIKAGPIDHRALAALGDGHAGAARVCGAADAGRAGHHAAASGQLRGSWGTRLRKARHGQCGD